MKFLPTILVLLLACVSTAEEIKITVKNVPLESARLSSLEGEKLTYIKKINSSGDGEFSFSGENMHTGFYRLAFTKTKWIDFVYDGTKISIETDAAHIVDSMKVIESETNRMYYKFVQLNRAYKNKTELLQLILNRFPQDDPYYEGTQQRLTELQNEYVEYVNIASQENPQSFIARYIRSSQLPVVDISVPVNEQLDYLKSSALDYVNFNDAELISSDCFTNKTIEYLTYYRNPQLPKQILEQEFMAAVDTLLNKARVNELVYLHVTEYLLDGFKRFGFDLVIDYILANYVVKDDLCLDETLESSLDRRILQAQKLKEGTVVPDIVLPDNNGNEKTLSGISKENTLVVFYASWCPHCKELMPQISDLYLNHNSKNTEVLAVSMDSTLTDWKSYLNENKFEWIDVCDTEGWNGKAAQDYHIYATPSMFLVDRDRKIIAKPKTIQDLRAYYQ